jgi:hypothetical protein
MTLENQGAFCMVGVCEKFCKYGASNVHTQRLLTFFTLPTYAQDYTEAYRVRYIMLAGMHVVY